MKINHKYQRYCGFRIIPRELQFGYGYTCDGLRCVRVRVRYGKIPPAVYPCSTLPATPSSSYCFSHCQNVANVFFFVGHHLKYTTVHQKCGTIKLSSTLEIKCSSSFFHLLFFILHPFGNHCGKGRGCMTCLVWFE